MSSYSIKQNNSSKTIYKELTLDELKQYLNEGKKVLIIKFGASWCRPCHNIKNLVESNYVEMPDNVLCFDIDVDESGDLFGHLFTKKMVAEGFEPSKRVASDLKSLPFDQTREP